MNFRVHISRAKVSRELYSASLREFSRTTFCALSLVHYLLCICSCAICFACCSGANYWLYLCSRATCSACASAYLLCMSAVHLALHGHSCCLLCMRECEDLLCMSSCMLILVCCVLFGCAIKLAMFPEPCAMLSGNIEPCPNQIKYCQDPAVIGRGIQTLPGMLPGFHIMGGPLLFMLNGLRFMDATVCRGPRLLVGLYKQKTQRNSRYCGRILIHRSRMSTKRRSP